MRYLTKSDQGLVVSPRLRRKYFTKRISAQVGVRKKKDDAGIALPVIRNVTEYSEPSFVLMSFRFLPGSYASGRSVMTRLPAF